MIIMKCKNEICCICGEKLDAHVDGKPYCKKHYLQMHRHGKILSRTIFDKNEWKQADNYAFCLTYNKKGIVNGIVKVDSDKVDNLKNYKIYIRTHDCGKQYACICIDGRKILLHRYLMDIYNNEYTLQTVVDHINGDSLDNRLSNLRICSHKDNMKNIKKKKFSGVQKSPNKNNKWIARIMSNYKTYNIGYFDTYEEAVYMRLLKEKELFKEYGPHKNLYYLLDQPFSIDAVKEALEGV